MSNLPELYRRLEQYSDFDQSDNCEKFLNTVDEIVLKKDSSSIQVLLTYFDDDSEYNWILVSLRKSLEQYDQNIYITCILEKLDDLVISCPYWTDEIINSLFNSFSDLSFFESHMHLASRESLLRLFEIMKKESPHHSQLIDDLTQQLETS